jgi:hypothetical protein
MPAALAPVDLETDMHHPAAAPDADIIFRQFHPVSIMLYL